MSVLGGTMVLAATAAGSSAQSITRTDWILRVLAPNHLCRGSHGTSAVSSTPSPRPVTNPGHPLVSRSSTANSSGEFSGGASNVSSSPSSCLTLAGCSSSHMNEYGATLSEYGASVMPGKET